MSVLQRRASPIIAAVLIALAVVALTACGSGSSTSSNVPTTDPATPSAAPAPVAPPAGVVIPAPASESMSLDPRTSTLAVLGTDHASLQIFAAAGSGNDPTPTRRIGLPAAVTALGAWDDGSVAAVAPGSLFVVTVATGAVATFAIPTDDPLSLARLSDGRILVGTGAGSIIVVGPDGAVGATVTGFVGVDSIAVATARDGEKADQVVVLDRAQSSVTTVDIDKRSLGEALRVGDGATGITSDHYGRFLTTDTRGNEFVGFAGDPLVARFRYPVAYGPYAVGYDDTNNLAWVATTGNNQILAYDLSTGIPVERRRLATVGQADSIAVDSRTGAVYVLSARGDGLQIIR